MFFTSLYPSSLYSTTLTKFFKSITTLPSLLLKTFPPVLTTLELPIQHHQNFPEKQSTPKIPPTKATNRLNLKVIIQPFSPLPQQQSPSPPPKAECQQGIPDPDPCLQCQALGLRCSFTSETRVKVPTDPQNSQKGN